MAVWAKQHAKKCCQCIIFMVKQQRTPIEGIVSTHPLELVHINYLYLEPVKEREENTLAVMDHFTCYTKVYVTQSQMAQTMAKALWDNSFVHYGLLEKILSAQGWNFESELIANLCKLTGTKTLRTSLYHPQSNGQCKTFISTLINMLGIWSASLIGKAILEHWYTHTTAPTIMPWASAPIS